MTDSDDWRLEGLARMEGSKEEFYTTAATMAPFGMATNAPAADS